MDICSKRLLRVKEVPEGIILPYKVINDQRRVSVIDKKWKVC